MWEGWIKGLEPHGIIKASQLLQCQDDQKFNSTSLRIPKGVSWYTQGTWEIHSIVVLYNAQSFTRGLSIYNWVREVPFDIPQGYVKGCSIYQWYMEEPHNPWDAVQEINDSSYVLWHRNTSLTYQSIY